MTQLTAADLAGMTPEAITEATDAGRFATLLGAPPADVALLDRATGTLNSQDVSALAALHRHDLIEKARTEGRITYTESEH